MSIVKNGNLINLCVPCTVFCNIVVIVVNILNLSETKVQGGVITYIPCLDANLDSFGVHVHVVSISSGKKTIISVSRRYFFVLLRIFVSRRMS